MATKVHPPQTIERLPSGIPGLDHVLGGGFLRGDIYLVEGPPGSGKTVFGNQICYHHAAAGDRAVYVTLLTETHARMLTHLQSLGFFDPAAVGRNVTYISGYKPLEDDGRAGLLSLLQRLVREQGATILVLDGLATVQAIGDVSVGFKHFVHELQAFIGLTGCTTFLLTEGGASHTEQPVVDGLIQLEEQLVGFRSARTLVARKLRGSDYLRGRHLFDIHGGGMTVYPRLESLMPSPDAAVPGPETPRRGFGIPRLDQMMRGGLTSGTTCAVLGGPGAGKTTLGLHFLAAGGLAREPGVFLGFTETPARLTRARLPSLAQAVETGLVEVIWQPVLDYPLDELGYRLLDVVRRNGVKRLFVDGLSGMREAALNRRRAGRFLTALSNELRSLDVTAIFSEGPLGYAQEVAGATPSALFDNLLLLHPLDAGASARITSLGSSLAGRSEKPTTLRLSGSASRFISIMKMRYSDFDASALAFRMGEAGIRIEPAPKETDHPRGGAAWEGRRRPREGGRR